MNVVVTGASGFLGTHVLRALALTDCSVVAATRDTTRLRGPFHRAVQWDIERNTHDAFDRFGRPDVVIHLAWSGLPNYLSDLHTKSELPKQFAFLESLVRSGLPAIFVAGTCFEYGMAEGCLNESGPARPSTSYGFAKDKLRRQLLAAQERFHFRMVWGRLFYVFGAGQNPNSLYGQFTSAVEEGRTSFDMSPADQLRDYLPVETASQLIVRLAVCRAAEGVINICSGMPIALRNLVSEWIERTGCSMKVNFGAFPYADYEPRNFWGDRSKLDRVLNVC